MSDSESGKNIKGNKEKDIHSRRNLVSVLVILGLLVIVAAFNMIRSIWEYQAGDLEYSKVEKEYVSVLDVENVKPKKAVSGDEPEEKEDKYVWTEDQSVPPLSIAHTSLAEKNKDYFCWLYIAPTGVSYPVVKGEDNEYYLHHTFDGDNNVNGCIYMDCQAWPDMMDYNVYIYGHNMRNGSMFGSLKHILNDPQIALDDPYFYLFQKDQIRKYHMYSIHVTAPRSDTFHNPATLDEYRDFIKLVKDESIVDLGVDVTTDDRTVTLSTCSGAGAGKKRLVIHGKLVGIIRTDRPESISYNTLKVNADDQ